MIYTATLNDLKTIGSHWIPVDLEPIPDPTKCLESQDIEPRQAYLQYIFYPGRFPVNIISKALSVSEFINDYGVELL